MHRGVANVNLTYLNEALGLVGLGLNIVSIFLIVSYMFREGLGLYENVSCGFECSSSRSEYGSTHWSVQKAMSGPLLV